MARFLVSNFVTCQRKTRGSLAILHFPDNQSPVSIRAHSR
jgi:hypothetical protein